MEYFQMEKFHVDDPSWPAVYYMFILLASRMVVTASAYPAVAGNDANALSKGVHTFL